eukprot:5879483-Amphidinium_carterae.2
MGNDPPKEGTEGGFGQTVRSVFAGGPEGWHCPSCKFYNFSHRSVCLSSKASKGAGLLPAGAKNKNNHAASKDSLSVRLRKQVAEAKDNPALKEHLEAALAAVTTKKTQALPVKDRRAKLLAQANAITTKMDQKTKLIQEAAASRDSLREELVEVLLHVRLLPKEELPLPKEAPRAPASFAVLGPLVAFARERASQGVPDERASWM